MMTRMYTDYVMSIQIHIIQISWSELSWPWPKCGDRDPKYSSFSTDCHVHILYNYVVCDNKWFNMSNLLFCWWLSHVMLDVAMHLHFNNKMLSLERYKWRIL